ncbi:MAG: hypothetical protein ACP5G2_05150 [Candidatus Bipolaricaulaceae bacterium]
MRTQTEAAPSGSGSRVGRALGWAIVPLAALASLGGLVLPDLYREPAELAAQMRGQDLVTLLAAIVLAGALAAARRGSARAGVLLVGLLGYFVYTYVGAAFAYALNELFLVYVALFSFSGFALAATVAASDPSQVAGAFGPRTPRRSVAVFLVVVGVMLAALWLSQIVPFLVTGRLPAGIAEGGNFQYVYALDLGVMVPLALLGAAWLWRRREWGYILAGYVLVKAAAMGLALLAMTGFSLRAGLPVEGGLTAVWGLIAAAGTGLSGWFLRHCRGQPGA